MNRFMFILKYQKKEKDKPEFVYTNIQQCIQGEQKSWNNQDLIILLKVL